MIRAFIAIRIEESVRENITRMTAKLQREWPALHPTLPGNLHFTLVFLGDIPADRVDNIVTAIKASDLPEEFETEVADLGFFGKEDSPRIIWTGARAGKDKILAIHSGVTSALAQLDITTESRPYIPHVTIARIRYRKAPQGFRDLMLKHQDASMGKTPVSSVVLMRSELTNAGPVYSELAEITLTPR